MKGWLKALCIPALLAARVLANEVELVRDCLFEASERNRL